MSQHSVKFDEDKRHAVYDRDGYKCHYCGIADSTKTGVKLSIDHIDSRASGGDAQNTKHSPATNLITACHACNFAKQDKTPREWNAYIKGRVPPEGGLKVDWKSVRKQAAKPVDIKAGEVGAKRARKARAERDKPSGPGVQHDPANGQFVPRASAARALSLFARDMTSLSVKAWISVALHDGAAALHALVGSARAAAVATAHRAMAQALRGGATMREPPAGGESEAT